MTETTTTPRQTALAQFFTPESVGERIWGEEILLGLLPFPAAEGIGVKFLKYKPGFSGNLQLHQKKHEAGIVLQGELILHYDPNDDGTLVTVSIVAGDPMYYFPPGAVHREEAGPEGCTVLEFGTRHFNDRVRMEKVYGQEEKPGLPTTSVEEIEMR